MANNQIDRLLEFVKTQMAAEAFLLRNVDNGVLPGEDALRARLELGNTHASKFMPSQAAQFIADYEVLAQYRNDPQQPGATGFSGTLFRCKVTDPARGLVAGELTLSFRSTEFIDDAVRDGKSTNELEIKELGWALGQIAEMEAWYAQLRQGPSLLGGKNFNVTGYSLGGHLATAFNILRREEAQAAGQEDGGPVIQTVTFNGAGVGDVKNGKRLTDVLNTFREVRANPESDIWLSLDFETRVAIVSNAQFRADKVVAEWNRLQDPNFQAEFAFSTRPPAGEQASLQYQIAALVAARDTVAVSNFPLPGGVNWVPSSPVFADPARRFGNMTEIVGSDGGNLGPSFVSNSGVHYGTRQEIYIEDQPLTRGSYNLLVDLGSVHTDPSVNDFADTHSLVLLVDSLSLMAAMEALDPNLAPETARQIFASMSNSSKTTAPFTQGKAEGDTLESTLDALRMLLGETDPRQTVSPYEALLPGNTWHLQAFRVAFHERLDSLNARIRNLTSVPDSQYSIDALAPLSAAGISGLAGLNDDTGKAYRYALRELNPFAVVAASGLYDAHNSQGALDLYNAAGNTPAGMTREYLVDRAAMLSWLMFRNTANAGDVFASQVTAPVQFTDLVKRGDDKLTAFRIVPAGSTLPSDLSPDSPTLRRFTFGSDGSEAVTGGAASDGLYGGPGTDVLTGKESNDYLEGGAGLDLYAYRAQNNLVFADSNDGADTIRDTDGKGVIRHTLGQSSGISNVYTSTVIADASDPQPDGTWRSADGRFTYSPSANAEGGIDLVVTINGETGGSLTLKDFRDGDLGIRLHGRAGPPSDAARTFYGDKQNWDSDPNEADIQPAPDGFGNYIRADGQSDGQTTRPDIAESNRIDEFFGSTGAEVERFATAGGNDVVWADGATGATGGADLVEAGAGRDIVWAGPGHDFVEGGTDGESIELVNGQLATATGGDVVNAGLGDDAIYALSQVELPVAIRSAETDASLNRKGDFLSGWDGNDRLIGATENDALFGGDGGDVLVGGAGDDDLLGDLPYGASVLDWRTIRTITPQDGAVLYRIDFENVLGAPIPTGAADALYGGGGLDWSLGGGGDDFIDSGSGNDVSFGEEGADILIGGAGNDVLVGDRGPGGAHDSGDYLDGGAGNDTLQGDGGDDVLIGGPGVDVMAGGAGRDIYVFNPGDGTETVFDTATGDPANVAERSIVIAGDGIDKDNVTFRTGSLVIDFGPSDPNDSGSARDAIHFAGFDQLNPANTPLIEEIRFADGSSMSYAGILAQGFDIVGTENDDDGHDAAHPQLLGTGVTDRISGLGGNDLLAGIAGNDVLDGGAGNDELQGGDGDDSLLPGAGADLLFGQAGDDTLSGGEDADVLQGNAGNDTYLFGRGDGQDTVSDFDATAGNADKVLFAAGIAPLDLIVGRLNYDLLLSLSGTADRVTVKDYFRNDGITPNSVERIEFADGTAWDVDTVKAMALAGTDADDSITGYATDDVLLGFGGDDQLSGEGGNDTFDGGTGNDSFFGDIGSDTYLFARGHGQDGISEYAPVDDVDRIVYAADILPGDIDITRSGLDLVLSLTGSTDRVLVYHYFEDYIDPTRFFLDRVEFQADGTVWDVDAIKMMVIAPTSGADTIVGYATDDVLRGLGGNDTIKGLGGDDTLDGGAGFDLLYGEGGSDTYLFARGSAHDYILNPLYDEINGSGDTTDVLLFAPDILPSQVSLTRSSDDLLFSVADTSDEGQIANYFLGGGPEQIRFADGTVWTESIISPLFPFYGTAGNDQLVRGQLGEPIYGLAGNDTVYAGGGNDTVDGGLGSDTLYGEAGNDLLIGGTGEAKNAAVSNSLYGGDGDDVLVAGGNAKSAERLDGGTGNNIVLGGAGPDVLIHSQGNGVLFGGAGIDTLQPSSGARSIVLGGAGGDVINATGAQTVLAFNKSDGADSVAQLPGGSTISIGGGTLYSNLSLEAVGSDLRLKTGSSHYVHISNWYSGSPPVANLQIVIEGTRDYKPSSSNDLNKWKIQVFDFAALVADFDAARALGQNFNVAAHLAARWREGSDTQAIGGSLAYQYARTGNLGALSYDQMRAVIGDPGFAVDPQSIAGSATTVEGSVAATASSSPERAAAETSDASVIDTLAHSEVLADSGASEPRFPVGQGDSFLVRESPAPHAFSIPAHAAVPALIAATRSGREVGQAFASAHESQSRQAAAEPLGAMVFPFAAGAEVAAGATGSVTPVTEAPNANDGDLAAPRTDGSSQRLAAGLYARHAGQWPALSHIDEVRAGVSSSARPAEALANATAWRCVERDLPTHLDSYMDTGVAALAGFSGVVLTAGLTNASLPVVTAVGIAGPGHIGLHRLEGLKEGFSALA
jgi:Ca2+-binding RTX toxin-like protein